MAYGHASALPASLGRFDTVMMGNVLQHLQDPVGVVLQASRLTDHLLITEADWLPGHGDDLACLIMYDVPFAFSWYQVKPRLLQNLLGRWGFDDQTLTFHDQTLLKNHRFTKSGEMFLEDCQVPTRHYTLSARRTSGMRVGDAS
jgi:hypothetical protein